MSRIVVAIYAEAAVARPGELFSVIGGNVQRIGVGEFPAIQPQLSLLVALELDQGPGGEIEMEFRLIAPDGQELLQAQASVGFEPRAAREHIWLGLPLPPLRFNMAGRYMGRLEALGEMLELPLAVEGQSAFGDISSVSAGRPN